MNREMTQEDKELLFKDLCARLPYGVICNDLRHGDSRITEIDIVAETVYCDDFDENIIIENVKLYLRPLSSMTEEENKEFRMIEGRLIFPCQYVKLTLSTDELDWLNKKMFDYRTDDKGKTMIEKGLALEAPEGMYK